MQQLGYWPILPGLAEGQTSASQDESIDFFEEARRPTDLTQLGYHYTPTPRNADESISMPSKPMGLTQMGLLPLDFFDQPPQAPSDMDDSQAQAENDEDDDDDADIQDLESTDPSGQVVGVTDVQTIGMYANQSRLYLYIYT